MVREEPRYHGRGASTETVLGMAGGTEGGREKAKEEGGREKAMEEGGRERHVCIRMCQERARDVIGKI